jgi:hypothetical protein
VIPLHPPREKRSFRKIKSPVWKVSDAMSIGFAGGACAVMSCVDLEGMRFASGSGSRHSGAF